MKKIYFLLFVLLAFNISPGFAQYDAPLYTPYTTQAARVKMNELVIKNIITKNLLLPLSDETEENWQDAFNAMEVYLYTTPFTTLKIQHAFDSADKRSLHFKRALLEVVYTLYPGKFDQPVFKMIKGTNNPRIFAMGAEYLRLSENNHSLMNEIPKIMEKTFNEDVLINPTLFMLHERLKRKDVPKKISTKELLQELLNKNFLPGKTVMFSFQRPDRNYPGLAVFRNPAGNFMSDSMGEMIHIPQLARSITNLPFYLRNGNTPQGIYSMYGFGVSMSNFIGPTANIQMGMPFELSKKKFFNNNNISDSEWTIENYRNLLPGKLQNHFPLFGSFYAGMIGRNEIIVHGTTVDPELYATKPYYPLTPTMGCLTTMEIWDGRRIESDQQKLVNTLLKAGGARGYTVVIEIDDKKEAVRIEEIIPFIK
ncbi:MAG: hypothetical protein ABIN48_03205 [Ginsengibacter sp.]